MQREHQAASTIQRVFRGAQERKSRANVIFAVLRIQTWYRRQRLRKEIAGRVASRKKERSSLIGTTVLRNERSALHRELLMFSDMPGGFINKFNLKKSNYFLKIKLNF